MGRLVFLLFSSLFLTTWAVSCAPLPAKSQGVPPGSILVTPPRDVVQNGEPHKKGKGSGKRLQDQIKLKFRNSKEFDILTINSDKFSHTKEVNVDKAQSVAKKKDADYFLIVKLGEFLDAAPMTFRADFVTLQKAKLYETETKDVIWRLKKPFKVKQKNYGNYLTLVEDLGNRIVKSILEASKKAEP